MLKSPSLLTVLSASLLLTASGCSTAPVTVSCPKPPPLPANLTQPCPDLSPLTGGTFGQITASLMETSVRYKDCQARHKALADRASER